ncbi:hypothetical protein FPL11_06250 [Spiribacter aquaticus]|uniref:CopG family transcriptional regulator n=1 Tax=Spiribacter aquaticus TaxID=1935996 RepID=A0A557RKG2_9GAMM|nr:MULTISPECIES: hypothetical protein [Spiribacter]TVO65658.1 hypothetical protein FPL11_06250 [Spiribacter aquaticus]
MSSVNYSVPEEVKEAFNETFKGRNKSAVISDLMREAVEREQRRQRHCQAVDRILARRDTAPGVYQADIRAARQTGRP